MTWSKLGHVFDGDDALPRPDDAEQRAEDRGLSGARAAGDEEGQPRVERGAQQRVAEVIDRAERPQRGQVVRGRPQDAQ